MKLVSTNMYSTYLRDFNGIPEEFDCISVYALMWFVLEIRHYVDGKKSMFAAELSVAKFCAQPKLYTE